MRITFLLVLATLSLPLLAQTTSQRGAPARQSTTSGQEDFEPEESHNLQPLAPLSKARLATSQATPASNRTTDNTATYRELLSTTDHLLRQDQGYAALSTLDAAQTLRLSHLATLSGREQAEGYVELAETLLSYDLPERAKSVIVPFQNSSSSTISAELQPRLNYVRARLAAVAGEQEQALELLGRSLEAGLLTGKVSVLHPALSRHLDPLKCSPEYAALRDQYSF